MYQWSEVAIFLQFSLSFSWEPKRNATQFFPHNKLHFIMKNSEIFSKFFAQLNNGINYTNTNMWSIWLIKTFHSYFILAYVIIISPNWIQFGNVMKIFSSIMNKGREFQITKSIQFIPLIAQVFSLFLVNLIKLNFFFSFHCAGDTGTIETLVPIQFGQKKTSAHVHMWAECSNFVAVGEGTTEKVRLIWKTGN